ncbi:uncharacterized protein FYW61_000148 isoform 2-T2 [Anableps anableps]
MSVELCTPSGPDGNNETTQDFTLGGNKPLHRFLRCQPKISGIVVLIIGASSLIVAISAETSLLNMWVVIPPEIFLGILLTICGILYIVTEHRPSKKTGMRLAMEIILLLYSFVGTIIMIIMSVLAGTALRSTKTQAIVVMTATAAETPVE